MAAVATSMPTTFQLPSTSTPPLHTLATQAKLSNGLDRIRLALAVMRKPDEPAFSSLAADSDAPDFLIQMLRNDALDAPLDRAAVIVAAHTLCNHRVFQAKFLAADGLSALCHVLSVPSPVDENQPHHPSSTSTTSQQQQQQKRKSSLSPASTRKPEPQQPTTTANYLAPGGVHRVVWNAAIRTIAKLMVVSHAACSKSIDTGSLALLAKAAKPGEPMDIRLRSAAGIAAIAAWSGPRRAMDIIQTEDVLLSMTSILTEQDERIPNDLRTATIDGLVVMSYRRHARGILQKYGCEEKIKAAARYATVSGDYTTAARTTVAAGHLTGRSIDEYGFLVEEPARDPSSLHHDGHDGAESAPETLGESESATEPEKEPTNKLVRRPTGLQQIHQQLLEEPYIEVEDLNVLEEIVHEDAGVLSSSPRDRNHARRAARTYGVSADEIEFISLLEEEASPSKKKTDEQKQQSKEQQPKQQPLQQQQSQQQSQRPQKQPEQHVEEKEQNGPTTSIVNDLDQQQQQSSPGRISSSLQESADAVDVQATPPGEDDIIPNGHAGNSPNRTSGSSPRVSSQLFQMRDPDFDRSLVREEEEEAASSATGTSSKSKITSPLLMFSSAARKAAEKDQNRGQLKKTNSQLSRDTENERKWKSVLEKRPELLKRERGRSSRVIGYRELASIPVPSALRRKLWPILLDTASLREYKPGLYGILCTQAAKRSLADDLEHTIEADVTRTMPLHSLFWAGGAAVGVQSLRSILRAYAFYVPDVGYCQGMSSIAAVLLMNAVDEEEAFLMMVQFMNRFQYKKVFAPGFPLMLHWIAELKPLVEHYMPQLSVHMERENVTLELYADKWLITALSHNFPHRHLLRVWDLMFLGGSPKVVLKACLMVLKCCESRLMQMDFEGMLSLLQREFSRPETGVLDLKDPEPFISEMREFRFMNDIKKNGGVGSGVAGDSATAAAHSSSKLGSGRLYGSRNGRKDGGKKYERRRKSNLFCCCFGTPPTKED